MTIRAKMQLEGIYSNVYGGHKVFFRAVYDNKLDEDVRFARATPSAVADFTIDNPVIMPQLVIGKHYYFDITMVEELKG